jgi:hypothetical protein
MSEAVAAGERTKAGGDSRLRFFVPRTNRIPWKKAASSRVF